MDWLIVAMIAGLAFWVGSAFGVHHGRILGRADEVVRRRLADLARPWENKP